MPKELQFALGNNKKTYSDKDPEERHFQIRARMRNMFIEAFKQGLVCMNGGFDLQKARKFSIY